MNIIAIDPGLNETGIALFPNGKLTIYTTIKIPAKQRELSMGRRLNILAFEVERFLLGALVDNTYKGVIEIADKFEYIRTKPGLGFKRNNQGSLHKLQMATGAIIVACGKLGIYLDDVTPAGWKGNTPKAITIQQVNLEYGLKLDEDDNHTADAIALGGWYIRQAKLLEKLN